MALQAAGTYLNDIAAAHCGPLPHFFTLTPHAGRLFSVTPTLTLRLTVLSTARRPTLPGLSSPASRSDRTVLRLKESGMILLHLLQDGGDNGFPEKT